MKLRNIVLFLLIINYSCAILISSSDKLSNYRDQTSLNLSDFNTKHSHNKREGVYSYYTRPPFVSYSSHPDNEYNNVYEINQEYEQPYQLSSAPPSQLQGYYDRDKGLAMKALLAPLFGIALLGVVAAMVNNPVLLQLGVLSQRRRRKRRGAAIKGEPYSVMIPSPIIDKLYTDLMILGHTFAQMPRSNLINEEKRLVENYFTCSELDKSLKANENCFKRLVCELWIDKADIKMITSQRTFIKKMLAELLKNKYVQNDIRKNLEDAKRFGNENGHCDIYACNIFTTV